MKVNSIINRCIELLDIDSNKEDLLHCFNIIENDLALDYFPLYETQQCDSKIVYFSELKKNIVRMVDCNCKFKIYPDCIKSKENITEIKYTYVPEEKDLYDDCSYGDEYFNCFIYGVISEYLLCQRFYEEAALWNRKYKKEIQKLCEVRK